MAPKDDPTPRRTIPNTYSTRTQTAGPSITTTTDNRAGPKISTATTPKMPRLTMWSVMPWDEEKEPSPQLEHFANTVTDEDAEETKPFPLLALPAELRVQIYGHVFSSPTPSVLYGGCHARACDRNAVPHLLTVSRGVRNEALPTYWSTTRFEARGRADLIAWLSKLPSHVLPELWNICVLGPEEVRNIAFAWAAQTGWRRNVCDEVETLLARFFEKGLQRRAVHVTIPLSSRIDHGTWVNIFDLGSYETIEKTVKSRGKSKVISQGFLKILAKK